MSERTYEINEQFCTRNKSDRLCNFTPVAPKACAWWEHSFEQWGERVLLKLQEKRRE